MNEMFGTVLGSAGYQGEPMRGTLGGLGQAQANAYAPSPVPQTLLSAEARLFSLNARLDSLIKTATQISETIGGPRGVSGESKSETVNDTGIVGRMHLCAESGFAKANSLEELLNSIHRQIGWPSQEISAGGLIHKANVTLGGAAS